MVQSSSLVDSLKTTNTPEMRARRKKTGSGDGIKVMMTAIAMMMMIN
jgi:hypothetical protein